MLLKFADEQPFSTGAAQYLYKTLRESDDPPTPRIILEIEIDGHRELAAIDTGAPFFVCSPGLSEKLGFSHDEKKEKKLNLLGYKLRGSLYRLDLILKAKEGSSLRIDATVFVPNTAQGMFDPDFMPVSIIGLLGCLENVRFAVDTFEKYFHFAEHP